MNHTYIIILIEHASALNTAKYAQCVLTLHNGLNTLILWPLRERQLNIIPVQVSLQLFTNLHLTFHIIFEHHFMRPFAVFLGSPSLVIGQCTEDF